MSFEWKIYDFLSFGWFWVLAQNFREKFWFWAKLKKPKKTTGLVNRYAYPKALWDEGQELAFFEYLS